MTELPHGWASASLANLIAPGGIFVDGDWVESKDQDPAGAYRLLQLADVGDGVFVDKSNRFVNEEKFAQLRCTEVLEGDVLIARMPDPLGRACLAPKLRQRCITVVDVAIVRPGPSSVRPRWLMHFLNAPPVRQVIELQSSGTTRRRISRGNLAQLELPVPPLAEQNRIADKLDALLPRVDACRDRLGRVPAILKRFRRSVLAAATTGELTREWRKEHGQPEWAQVSVGEVATLSSGFGFPPALQGKVSGDLPFAKVSDISRSVLSQHGLLSTAANYIDESDAVRIKAKPVAAGSTVFAKIGEGLKLNRRALAMTRIVLDNNCMAATPDVSRVLPQYLFLIFQTIDLTPFAVATAVPSVRRSDVERVAIGLPSILEQGEITRRVSELFGALAALERVHAGALSDVEKLTPAALAKAFRGELVPQDPTDEPASTLLARLHSRPSSPGNTRKPKRGGTRASRTKAKADTNMLTRKDVTPTHLTTILKERGALTAEALWNASQLEIDDFYDQLKDEEAGGLLRENRGENPNAPRLLEPAA